MTLKLRNLAEIVVRRFTAEKEKMKHRGCFFCDVEAPRRRRLETFIQDVPIISKHFLKIFSLIFIMIFREYCDIL